MQTDLLAVRKKEVNEKPSPARPLTTKGKGKEPVRQTAREEASDTRDDELMEDNEHIFGMFGPLTAANCHLYADLPNS